MIKHFKKTVLALVMAFSPAVASGDDPLKKGFYDPEKSVSVKLDKIIDIGEGLRKEGTNLSEDIRQIKRDTHNLEIKSLKADYERSLLQREQALIIERQQVIKDKTEWAVKKVENHDRSWNSIIGWWKIIVAIACPVIAWLLIRKLKSFEKLMMRINFYRMLKERRKKKENSNG